VPTWHLPIDTKSLIANLPNRSKKKENNKMERFEDRLPLMSELSPVARASILRGLKGNWGYMTKKEKIGFLREEGAMEYCLAAEIPQDELDAIVAIINKSQPFSC
jgi:hypothetical protein